ncbi:MAG: hypothetical protein M3296_01820 [Actinomycetota bacterium]|nr:hypothetical protein [Actinomycetota bacterium]
MTQAWIGFAGGLIAALVSAVVALRQSRMAERLARLNSALETEVHRRTALIDRELHAEEVLTRYREPLAAAAFDLQSRLYNILELDFFGKFGGAHPRAEEALRTTLFRLAQYFGWTEILRRDIQFLSFPEADETRHVAELQAEIAKRFLTDQYGPALMIWSDEQRAIGERMIVEEHGKVLCMGYARFRDACDDTFAPWCERLRSEVTEESARDRVREVQHLLCDLVETLDRHRVRYTRDLERA